MKIPQASSQQFDQVVTWTRAYFALSFPEGMNAFGTKHTIHSYVCSKMGDVPDYMITAAVKVLKQNGAILYTRHTWKSIADR